MSSHLFVSSAVAAFAALLLPSCITPYTIPKDYSGPTAVIRSSSEDVGMMKGKGYYVSEIDGKMAPNSSPMSTPYGGGLAVTLSEKETKVAVQPMTLTLVGATVYAADGAAMVDSIAGGARFVSGKMTFTPKPNGVYRVKGILEPKGQESVWLVDDKTGKVIGQKIVKR